ncbi:MAG TPA: RDD family protein [Paenalcaligenes sp.]|nr:RDD family protein [Paenalcaligenes sp.]
MLTHQFTPPGRWRRFACMIYEGMLLFGLVFIAGLLFDVVTDSRHALKLRVGRQIFLFVLISIYFLSAWLKSGQTLAMKTWHIRLQSRTPRPLKLGRLLLRYVLMWLFPLLTALLIETVAKQTGQPALSLLIVFAPFSNFIYTWFDPDKQFMHDRLSHTVLVDARPIKNSDEPTT